MTYFEIWVKFENETGKYNALVDAADTFKEAQEAGAYHVKELKQHGALYYTLQECTDPAYLAV